MNYSVRAALDFAGANTYNSYRYRSIAGVAELADARDLKSLDSDVVPVQARSPAPVKTPAIRRVFLLVQRIPTRGGLRPLELPPFVRSPPKSVLNTKIPAIRRVFLLVQRIPIRGGLRPLAMTGMGRELRIAAADKRAYFAMTGGVGIADCHGSCGSSQ